MKKLILLCLFISSCVTTSTTPVCRHVALMCGTVMLEKSSKTYIATGKVVDIPGTYHAQAISDGKWVQFSNGDCIYGDRENFLVDKMQEVGEFFYDNWIAQ